MFLLWSAEIKRNVGTYTAFLRAVIQDCSFFTIRLLFRDMVAVRHEKG